MATHQNSASRSTPTGIERRASLLDRQTSARNLLRFLLLPLNPVYFILAIVHASVHGSALGCLALTGYVPTWASGALAFHLVRRRRDGKVAKLSKRPATVAIIDTALSIAFSGGIVALAFSMASRSGYRGDVDVLVTGILAVMPLLAGSLIHAIFVIDALRALGAHLDSHAPHCTECGSRIRRVPHGAVRLEEAEDKRAMAPAWAGKGVARGVYDAYEALLAEPGVEDGDDERGNGSSEETMRGAVVEGGE